MKRGDLIRATPLATGETTRSPQLLSSWGKNKDWKEDHVGNLLPHEFAVVLEVYVYPKNEMGVSGCKVLSQSGLVGWLWCELVEVIL